MSELLKCGRCAGDKDWILHYPSCEKGIEIVHPMCPRPGVAVIVETIVAMDPSLAMDTAIPIVDHIAKKAVLRYVSEDTGLNCAAENAYLTWARMRSD